MLRTILLCALTSSVPSASAQAQWVRQSPVPGAPSAQVAFGATHAYVVASGLQPYESTDGGWHWHPRPLGNGGFNTVTFFDDLHGWMFGNHSSLGFEAYRTTDGGVSWTPLNNVPFGSYYKAQFVSPTHGWIGGNSVLAETFDGGDSWSLVNLPQFGFNARFAFRDAQLGLIGIGGTVWRTTNGGSSWTQVASFLADTLQFADANVVVASIPPQFGPPDFQISSDAGLTWQSVDVPGVALENPARISPTTWIANSGGIAHSDLYRSTDGCFTWTKVLPGTWWPFEGGAFRDASNGLELGYGGQMWRTVDGGVSWIPISSGLTTHELEDLEMLDESQGVAVGGDGTVLVTENGGTSWRVDRPGFEFSHGDTLLSVTGVAPHFVFAAGLYGTLVKSLDGGRTWSGVAGPGAGFGDYWACKFVTADEGWIGGGFQAIYHTTDGGTTWTHQWGGVSFGSSEAVYDLEFVDANHGWAVGTFHGVLVTNDGGAHWTPLDFGTTFPFCREIDMVDAQVGWCSSRESFVARTTNGGLSWTQQPLPADPLHAEQFVFALAALSSSECWAATAHGRVYHTTDGGTNWTYVDTGFHGAYDSWLGMRARPNGNVWLAGGGGGILRRTGTAPETGTAYCFGDGSASACPCSNEAPAGWRTGCLASNGRAGRLVATGAFSLSSDSARLECTGVANTVAMCVQGTERFASGLGQAFGDGLLCVGGTLIRVAVVPLTGIGVSFPPAGSNVSTLGLVQAPGLRTYQVYFRDAASYCTSGTFDLTNAVEALWTP